MTEPMLGGLAQSPRDRSEPLLRPGNSNCGGCGMSVVLNMLSRAVADRPIQMVIPACCAMVATGPFPASAFGAPVLGSTFASTAAVATGLARVAQLNKEPTRVICFAGDGATADIGMAALSAAAERNEDLLYVCYDNEIYGNTGGQRSSATPLGAVTTTTPAGKRTPKKDIVRIMAAHRVPYAATLSMAHPDDMLRKMRLAVELRGFRFLHALSPCPTGWKSEPAEGVELVRLAVKAGIYPVYEVFDGSRVCINVDCEPSKQALERYISLQGRFKRTGVDLEQMHRLLAQALDELKRWARA